MGVPVRGERGAAAGAGLQADPAAAELPGPVGALAGRRGHAGAEAARGEPPLPQGRPAAPAEVVLLQVGVPGRTPGRGSGTIRLRRPRPHPRASACWQVPGARPEALWPRRRRLAPCQCCLCSLATPAERQLKKWFQGMAPRTRRTGGRVVARGRRERGLGRRREAVR